jgi:serine/threonine protein kinase
MSSPTRIGTTVAGYRLEKLLGRGGMSVVYLAEHQRLGRKVALKLLSAALTEDESFRERFERESRRAAEIDHPNIVPIFDAGDADGQFYIAMRYVPGSDLKAVIKRDGPLSIGRTLYMLEQAASALDAAHDRDLVHRDVKPANILIEEPSDRVFLTDFGVVKHTSSHGLTRTGFFIGTVDYAAPEQIEGLPVDARTDVYSLGCVFYECLTGRAPFDRDAEVAVMHAHLTEPPPSLRNARPDLPRDLDRVVAGAMAKSKDERPATCEALVEAAHAAALGRATRTTREPIPAAVVGVDGAEADSEAAAEMPLAADSESGEVAAISASGNSNPGAPDSEVTPPEQPPPSRPSGQGRPAWLIPAIIAVAAAVVSGAVVYFLTDSNGGSGTAPTTAASPTSPATVTPPTATAPAEVNLQAVVPGQLFSECQPQDPAAGASETALCLPTESTPNHPDRWEVSVYADDAALATAYNAAVTAAQENAPALSRNSGRCPVGVGEHPWKHPGGEFDAGRVFCYTAGGEFVLGWTHLSRKGQEVQPDHLPLLAIARIDESSHFELADWWRFWHHRIGKQT